MTSTNKKTLRKHLPSVIIDSKSWGCWKLINGQKRPVAGFTSDTSSASRTLDEAIDLCDAEGYGLAIRLGEITGTDFSIVGVDFDKCFDDAGELRDWAAEAIEFFDGFYFEVSPSGTGIKGIAAIENTRGLSINASPVMDDNGGVIELHLPHAGASKRYYTVTTNAFDGEFNGNGESTLDVFEEAIREINDACLNKEVFEPKKPVASRKDKQGKFVKTVDCFKSELVTIDDVVCKVNVPIDEDSARLAKAESLLDGFNLPSEGGRNEYIARAALPFISNAVGLVGSTKAFEIWDAKIRSSASYTEDFSEDIATVWNSVQKNAVLTVWEVEVLDCCSTDQWQYADECDGVNWNTKGSTDDLFSVFTGETPEEAAQKLYIALAEVEDGDSDSIDSDGLPDWITERVKKVREVGKEEFAKKRYGSNVAYSEDGLKKNAKPVVVAIDHCIAMGMKNGLIGDSKAGKTTLACDLAVSLTTGTDFLGERTFKNNLGRPAKTYLITAETPACDIADTIRDIRMSRGINESISGDVLKIWQEVGGWDDDDWITMLIADLHEFRPEFVIVDPLYFHLDDDSMQRATFLKQIRRLAALFDSFGATPIFVDHINKCDGAKRKPSDEMIVPLDETAMYGNGRESWFRGWVLLTPREVKPDYLSGRIKAYMTCGGAWHQRRQMGGEWAIDLRVQYSLLESSDGASPYKCERVVPYSNFDIERKQEKEDDKEFQAKEQKRFREYAVVAALSSKLIKDWEVGNQPCVDTTSQELNSMWAGVLESNSVRFPTFKTRGFSDRKKVAKYVIDTINASDDLGKMVKWVETKGSGYTFTISSELCDKAINLFVDEEIDRIIEDGKKGMNSNFENLSDDLDAKDLGSLDRRSIELFAEDFQSAVTEDVLRIKARDRRSPEMLVALSYWQPAF